MFDVSHFVDKYDGTCSTNNLKENHLTFVSKEKYLHYIKEEVNKDGSERLNNVGVLIGNGIKDLFTDGYITVYKVDDVMYRFALIHNKMYSDITPGTGNYVVNVSDIGTNIHETVVIGVDGLRLASNLDGSKFHIKHTGGVNIDSEVEIGPYSIIHRGTIEFTTIRKGVKMASGCNIGHNCDIGDNTVLGAGVMMSGSVTVGKGCWLGTGCVIRNGITICDDVVIGTGSVVVKDIDVPGVYVGNPAVFLKEYDKNTFVFR